MMFPEEQNFPHRLYSFNENSIPFNINIINWSISLKLYSVINQELPLPHINNLTHNYRIMLNNIFEIITS